MAISPHPATMKNSSFDKEQDYLMGNNILDSSGFEGLRYLARLLELSHVLNGETQKCVDRLCQEVEIMTHKRVKIFIRQDHEKSYEYTSTTSTSFPLQFKRRVYGMLSINDSMDASGEPAISLPIARLLAQTCGWILYTIEQSAFVQKQYQQLDYQIHGPLTRREKEVLSLMFRGCDQQAIAEALSISPATVRKHRQHIYNQLGVHCERDAVLAAYFSGMFSLIGEYPL